MKKSRHTFLIWKTQNKTTNRLKLLKLKCIMRFKRIEKDLNRERSFKKLKNKLKANQKNSMKLFFKKWNKV